MGHPRQLRHDVSRSAWQVVILGIFLVTSVTTIMVPHCADDGQKWNTASRASSCQEASLSRSLPAIEESHQAVLPPTERGNWPFIVGPTDPKSGERHVMVGAIPPAMLRERKWLARLWSKHFPFAPSGNFLPAYAAMRDA